MATIKQVKLPSADGTFTTYDIRDTSKANITASETTSYPTPEALPLAKYITITEGAGDTTQEYKLPTGDLTYVAEFGTASKTWTVVHNLRKFPSIIVVDYNKNQIEGEVTYIDENSLKVVFTTEVSGYVYCN